MRIAAAPVRALARARNVSFGLVLLGLGGSALAAPVRGTTWIDGRLYDTWREPGDTFQIVCEQPCPIDEELILVKYAGFAEAKRQLVALFGIDTLKAHTPVDLHLNADSWCGPYPNPWGFSGFSGGYGPQEGFRYYTCTFEQEKQQRGELRVPFTVEEAGRIEAQVLNVHEYGHTIEFRRHMVSYEAFVTYASFHISGDPPVTTPCDPLFDNWPSTALTRELCQRHGLRALDIAPAFRKMDRLSRSGKGYYGTSGRTTSIYQLRQNFNRLLGADTLDAYLAAGFPPQFAGDSTRLESGGGEWSLGGDFVRLDVPPGAVKKSAALKMEWADAGWAPYEPWLNWSTMFDLVPIKHTYTRPKLLRFRQPVGLSVRIDPALHPEGTDLQSLRLYALRGAPGGGLHWEEVPGSHLVGGRLVATIDRTGTYGVFSPTGPYPDSAEASGPRVVPRSPAAPAALTADAPERERPARLGCRPDRTDEERR